MLVFYITYIRKVLRGFMLYRSWGSTIGEKYLYQLKKQAQGELSINIAQ